MLHGTTVGYPCDLPDKLPPQHRGHALSALDARSSQLEVLRAGRPSLTRFQNLGIELEIRIVLELLQCGLPGHQLAAELLKIGILVLGIVLGDALEDWVGAGRAAFAEAGIHIEIPSWAESGTFVPGRRRSMWYMCSRSRTGMYHPSQT